MEFRSIRPESGGATPLFSDDFGWKAGLGLAGALCVVGATLWLWVDPQEGAEARS